ncbi:hypothetical protein QL112_000535 [Xenorhabdus griffiniae]|uniref:Uncharacterized protein n=1 Tax=Xenorhabdus griffiniae TaxID=351672 RepID=A0ABY9XI20_9GAMM|nr:hypothetical protein [Xenorhabdus griffiniae]WNH02271.1 hypothetical protein QL112_000535 [Xenorhabdus griffiniae]
MTRIILSLILVVVLGLSVYQGVGMVQPTMMTTLPTKETGYVNVQKALSIIAAKPHPTVSTQQEKDPPLFTHRNSGNGIPCCRTTVPVHC